MRVRHARRGLVRQHPGHSSRAGPRRGSSAPGGRDRPGEAVADVEPDTAESAGDEVDPRSRSGRRSPSSGATGSGWVAGHPSTAGPPRPRGAPRARDAFAQDLIGDAGRAGGSTGRATSTCRQVTVLSSRRETRHGPVTIARIGVHLVQPRTSWVAGETSDQIVRSSLSRGPAREPPGWCSRARAENRAHPRESAGSSRVQRARGDAARRGPRRAPRSSRANPPRCPDVDQVAAVRGTAEAFTRTHADRARAHAREPSHQSIRDAGLVREDHPSTIGRQRHRQGEAAARQLGR